MHRCFTFLTLKKWKVTSFGVLLLHHFFPLFLSFQGLFPAWTPFGRWSWSKILLHLLHNVSCLSTNCLPGTFCHLNPLLLRPNAPINSLDIFMLSSPPHMAIITVAAVCPLCVCVLSNPVCACVFLEPRVSSCVGNLTLWPEPVAADGRSTKAKQKRGAKEEVLLSPAGSMAQPEQRVRWVQQQERVGAHVGCTEAHGAWERANVRTVSTCVLLWGAVLYMYLQLPVRDQSGL